MGQGYYYNVDFSNVPSSKNEDTISVEHSSKAGGLRDVTLSGIEGISEPNVEPVDYSNVPAGRNDDNAKPFEKADRAGGFAQRTASAATKSIDTQRDSDPFID